MTSTAATSGSRRSWPPWARRSKGCAGEGRRTPRRAGLRPALARLPADDAGPARHRRRRRAGRGGGAGRRARRRGLAERGGLDSRHRQRVASHSKTFTSVGIMRLRERRRLGLDDEAGRHVPGLHPEVAATTIRQLLSHGAGIIRNGRDGGHFADRKPYPDAAEIARDLAEPPVIAAETRLKYSNHGYALLGRVIEAVTGEPYHDWIMREVVRAAGLTETTPDAPIPGGVPFARGHTLPLGGGRRLPIPGDNRTDAYAAAAGFVSTASDLARFFARLSPEAPESILSPASRRALVHRQWRDPYSPFDRHYGLGTICGATGGWEWFGHSGSFQGYSSRTVVVPEQGLTVSVLVNAITAPADPIGDGVLHLLRLFAERGAPGEAVQGWTGRYANLFGTVDLLPCGDRVLVALPAFWNPIGHVAEVAVEGPDAGRIVKSGGFGSQGEEVRLVRDAEGAIAELWLAGTRSVPEAVHAAELEERYGAG
ncbi:serine hydrolase domain-containing protein [Roseomonas sp. CCTCC AB2023176]|uniref:serine hydrolase domain-containing protein n=1 Tax=Roseomonas sp. CCTCC AB2023176 TaxID=3342640 RepID=UPI0035DA7D64